MMVLSALAAWSEQVGNPKIKLSTRKEWCKSNGLVDSKLQNIASTARSIRCRLAEHLKVSEESLRLDGKHLSATTTHTLRILLTVAFADQIAVGSKVDGAQAKQTSVSIRSVDTELTRKLLIPLFPNGMHCHLKLTGTTTFQIRRVHPLRRLGAQGLSPMHNWLSVSNPDERPDICWEFITVKEGSDATACVFLKMDVYTTVSAGLDALFSREVQTAAMSTNLILKSEWCWIEGTISSKQFIAFVKTKRAWPKSTQMLAIVVAPSPVSIGLAEYAGQLVRTGPTLERKELEQLLGDLYCMTESTSKNDKGIVDFKDDVFEEFEDGDVVADKVAAKGAGTGTDKGAGGGHVSVRHDEKATLQEVEQEGEKPHLLKVLHALFQKYNGNATAVLKYVKQAAEQTEREACDLDEETSKQQMETRRGMLKAVTELDQKLESLLAAHEPDDVALIVAHAVQFGGEVDVRAGVREWKQLVENRCLGLQCILAMSGVPLPYSKDPPPLSLSLSLSLALSLTIDALDYKASSQCTERCSFCYYHLCSRIAIGITMLCDGIIAVTELLVRVVHARGFLSDLTHE
jgi:hypothetical protein